MDFRTGPFVLAALHILLVDDNANMREITGAILRSAGARSIHEADDGAKAMSILRERPIDMAIVDFQMAGLNGEDFTRQVRTEPDSPNPFLPIIMLSGHGQKRRVALARDAGVTEFVVKPLTARTLLERIEAVIYRPRPFISVEAYFGPCRRRTPAGIDYSGPRRRAEDQDEVIVSN
jgi:two-component system chemotaxis response regulator CheY